MFEEWSDPDRTLVIDIVADKLLMSRRDKTVFWGEGLHSHSFIISALALSQRYIR